MPVTPTGILSEPLASLRDQLAACPAFQAWVGAVDTEAAKANVHLLVAPDEAGPYPLAIIDFGDTASERVTLLSGSRWALRSGSDLIILFRAEATGEEPDATFTFTNALGAVMAEMEATAGNYSNGTPGLVAIELVMPPTRTNEEKRATEGDFFEAGFSCTMSRAK